MLMHEAVERSRSESFMQGAGELVRENLNMKPFILTDVEVADASNPKTNRVYIDQFVDVGSQKKYKGQW